MDCGLILEKGKVLSAKWWGFFWFQNSFQYENNGGLGPWFMECWRPPERGGMLTGVRSRTAPELGSSPARVRCGEGRTVKPARRSPGLVRQRGGRAAMASRRWERSSEVAMFNLGEEGMRRGMSAARVR
jgi:hypothetical protein